MSFRSVEERTQFEAGPEAIRESGGGTALFLSVHPRPFAHLFTKEPRTLGPSATVHAEGGLRSRVLSCGNREPLLADGFSNLNAALRIGEAVQPGV